MRAPFALLISLLVASNLQAQERQSSGPGEGRRSPGIARTLAVIPGAGHVYAGAPLRGLVFATGIVGSVAVAAVTLEDCLGLLGNDSCSAPGPALAIASTIAAPVLWVWSGKDAGRIAARRNRVAASPVVALTRVPVGTGAGVRAVRIGMRFGTR